MVFLVSDEVKPKSGGPRMIVTGYSSGMVECRWYDGYGIKREAFREVMPAYDKIFHAATERIVEASSQRRWPEAYAGYREVMDACVACHDAWRPFALSRQKPAQTPRP